MIESKARLVDVSTDYMTGRFRLTFEMESFLPAMVDRIKECCLRLTIRKWKNKRSLDANAFMWVILGQMAQILATSPEELYEEMLQRYGILDSDENGYVVITVRADIDMVSRAKDHWKYYRTSEDGSWKFWIRLKGTSEYDSAEMAYFIERVVEEAQELGIDTSTPDERARLAALWGKAS